MKIRSLLMTTVVLAAVSCGGAQSTPVEPVASAQPAAQATPAEPAAPAAPAEPAAPAATVDVQAIVAAADRDDADRQKDASRKPAELLAFLGLRPGMKVADLGAGFGYTTELLARAVGPEGVVYGQNPRFVLERFAEKGWSARLSKPVMAKVVRVDREFDDPLPPEATNLDLVVNVMFYHDFEWMKTDRAAHNQAIFAALAPGGHYVIVDHSAKQGRGAQDAGSLHRIEQSVVKEELTDAGFVLVEEGDFMRNPEDTRDWNAAPMASKGRISDRFVLKFQKPAAAQ